VCRVERIGLACGWKHGLFDQRRIVYCMCEMIPISVHVLMKEESDLERLWFN
jgi:hypothetical protein